MTSVRACPFRPQGFLGRCFDFLGSLGLGVFLLIVLGVVCALGTFSESMYTTRLAQRFIYHSSWFNGLLLALFVNVFFAALLRYPWRWTQTGFVVTHFGILILLVGSIISHTWGIEGHMELREGQVRDTMRLDQTVIRIQEEGASERHFFDTSEVEWGQPTKEDPQVYRLPIPGIRLEVNGFYADSEIRRQWQDGGPTENPGILIELLDSESNLLGEELLAPRIPEQSRFGIGQTVLAGLETTLEEALATPAAANAGTAENRNDQGTLSVSLEGATETLELAVADCLSASQPLQDSGYSLEVTEYFRSAVLDDQQRLVEGEPGRKANPVVVLRVWQNEQLVADRLIRYALFPDFAMVHDQTAELPLTIRFSAPENEATGSRLSLLLTPEGRVFRRVELTEQIRDQREVSIGERFPVPGSGSDLQLGIKAVFSRAYQEEQVVPLESKPGDFGNRAARITLSDEDGNSDTFWLPMLRIFSGTGMGGEFEHRAVLGTRAFRLTYDQLTVPLGFSLRLEDFRVLRYEGGERPMGFESDVTLLDPDQGLEKTVKIYMNHPLDHEGYRIFQSSYREGPVETSIFSIARDPGILVIYIGSTILCIGIALIYYCPALFRRLERRRRLKEVPQNS